MLSNPAFRHCLFLKISSLLNESSWGSNPHLIDLRIAIELLYQKGNSYENLWEDDSL